MSRILHRSLAAAAILAVLAVGTASADTALADGDLVTDGNQSLVDLGEVAPGAVLTVEVGFELRCSTTNHVDAGQTITLDLGAQSAPTGGAVVGATSATIGPVPATWPADAATCPDPLPTIAGERSTVTLRAPTTLNVGYVYTVGWRRSIAPLGAGDGSALSGTFTSVSFLLDVVADSPPTLTVPGDMTVEADTAGGWNAAWTVTASDAEDDPDPTPVCSPAAGEVLPLGATTVACSVADSEGRTATGSFVVTVVDTTSPSLTVGGDVAVDTDDPAGAPVAFGPPVATDIADPAPAVACAPASGTVFPVGTTTVTCSVTDASGNVASASFDVTVRHVPSRTATATWLEPVGPADPFVVNRGRTLPIKVELSVDGVVRSTGDADLRVVPCGGGEALHLPLSYGGGRWMASLDTASVAAGCASVTARIDGLDAGAFRLELRNGDTAAKTRGRTR